MIGVIIGGVHHGIMGAMVGAVAGSILVSSGIEVQVKSLQAEGRLRASGFTYGLSYVLAIAGTFIGLKLAALLASVMSGGETGIKEGDVTWMIIMYVGPAFAGGIAALIPVWIAAAGQPKQEQ